MREILKKRDPDEEKRWRIERKKRETREERKKLRDREKGREKRKLTAEIKR